MKFNSHLLKGQAVCLLFLLMTAVSAPKANAWGWTHRLIAYLAQEHLTPTTQETMDEYLDAPLNYVSNWLDQFRSAPWKDNYQQQLLTAPSYTFKAWEHAVSVDEDCYPLDHTNRVEGNGVGYGAYLRYVDNLKHYRDMPDSAVVVDLKSLIHVVGDVHCPGHILYSIDKETPDTMGGGIAGGYGIWVHEYKGEQKTMHWLLDCVEKCHDEFTCNLEVWRQYIDTMSVAHQREVVRGTMADYIQDAALRSKVIYDWLTPGQPVDDSYFTEPSHEQLFVYLTQVAGYRLAHILNTIFDPEYRGIEDNGFDKLAATESAPKGAFVEGIVISDRSSANMAANPHTSWKTVDVSVSKRTAYLQNAQGTQGIKLVFANEQDNRLARFSKVRINIEGCRIIKEENPERYTVEGVAWNKVQELAGKTVPAEKKRHINELKPSDVYTWVTLEDVEFQSKEGSYTNIREFYAQPTFINSFKLKEARYDEAGVYVKDNQGSAIFLPVNTVCDWRRRGDRLPQGVGEVSGVVVAEQLLRCGTPGPMQLRISNPSDVKIAAEKASSYKTVVEWNWDRNYYAAINCKSGERKWLKDTIAVEPVLPDVGKGLLSTNAPVRMFLSAEYNSRSAQDGMTAGEGARENSALNYYGKMTDFYGKGKGVFVEFSTAGLSCKGLTFDFTWVFGTKASIYTGYAPEKWTLSYSTDGKNFTTLDKEFKLLTLARDKGGETPANASLGFTENSIVLPECLIGKNKVVLRLSPDFQGAKADPANVFYLRFGKVSVKAF